MALSSPSLISNCQELLIITFIYCSCGERDFLEILVKKHIAAKEVNHKGQGLFVNLQLLHGDLKQVQKEYPHLVNNTTAVARKMGFPEVILPGR